MAITDTLNSSQVEYFSQDVHNRLVDAFTGDDCIGYDAGVGSGPYDQDFAYSAIHNITSFDGASYTYGTGNASGAGDAGPHAVTSISAGAVTFGYDDNGNRITRTENSQTTSYSYGDDNRLDQVTLPDTSTVEFVYDADGRRVSRANGDDATRYVVGLMEIDLDVTTVTETRTFYSFAGTSVAVRAHTAGTVAFSFGNHLGSPVAAFEDTTNTVSRMGYEPYGTERAVTGSLPSDHRFTNQIADNTTHPSGGTGLLFYNARYYDPEVGAFVAADTLIPDPTSPVDFNRYAYVRGNPGNYTDPSGHCNVGVVEVWDRPSGGCNYTPLLVIVGGTGTGGNAQKMGDWADLLSDSLADRGVATDGVGLTWDAPGTLPEALLHLEACDHIIGPCPLKGSGSELTSKLLEAAGDSASTSKQGIVAHSQGVAALSFAFKNNPDLWDYYDFVVLVAGSASAVNAFQGFVDAGGDGRTGILQGRSRCLEQPAIREIPIQAVLPRFPSRDRPRGSHPIVERRAQWGVRQANRRTPDFPECARIPLQPAVKGVWRETLANNRIRPIACHACARVQFR